MKLYHPKLSFFVIIVVCFGSPIIKAQSYCSQFLGFGSLSEAAQYHSSVQAKFDKLFKTVRVSRAKHFEDLILGLKDANAINERQANSLTVNSLSKLVRDLGPNLSPAQLQIAKNIIRSGRILDLLNQKLAMGLISPQESYNFPFASQDEAENYYYKLKQNMTQRFSSQFPLKSFQMLLAIKDKFLLNSTTTNDLNVKAVSDITRIIFKKNAAVRLHIMDYDTLENSLSVLKRNLELPQDFSFVLLADIIQDISFFSTHRSYEFFLTKHFAKDEVIIPGVDDLFYHLQKVERFISLAESLKRPSIFLDNMDRGKPIVGFDI